MNMSFYTGAVGAFQQQQRMNVQANNIANVNNYGYKAERATFHHLMYGNVVGIDNEDLPRGTGTKMVKASVDYTTNGYQETGRTFDFAIVGDGFFALYDPNTEDISFSRDGAFMMARYTVPPTRTPSRRSTPLPARRLSPSPPRSGGCRTTRAAACWTAWATSL